MNNLTTQFIVLLKCIPIKVVLTSFLFIYNLIAGSIDQNKKKMSNIF